MRKIIALTISCLIIMSGATIVYGTEYTDVKTNHWAHEAVEAMSDRSIIKGYPNGRFLPNNTITYGEFIKMALIAGTGSDVGNAKSGHWASNYYDKALELKYFTAHDIDKSQLKFEITRAHMALILSSVLGDVKVENYDEIQKGIKDITFQTKYEYDITKSYAAGILTGYTDNTFRPDKTLSRAESATVIHRLVDESKRELPVGEPEGTTESAITYPTSGLLDMSKLTPDKTIAVSVHFTDEYELYTDASEWDMKMYRAWDGDGCAFDHTLRGHIYLIKDSEIIAYCNTTPKYDSEGNYLYYQRSIAHYDISKADYIIAVPTDAETDNRLIKAIMNPFKF
ncbi:MAG TPA: S-layer homology domain-containing protein [Anaerovoracaceae bacterium]|nr:S-layer homology domain-containing protein [Anaerovoracaceae bacterium]